MKGSVSRASVRAHLVGIRSCIGKHLKPGQARGIGVQLDVEGGRVTTARVTGTNSAALEQCVKERLKSRRLKGAGKTRVVARLRLSQLSEHEARAAARRSKLAKKISALGMLRMLKLLGTQGGGGVSSVFGQGPSADSSTFGGIGGRSVQDAQRARRRRLERDRERKAREKKRAKLLARGLRLPVVRSRPAPWVQPELSTYDQRWFGERRRLGAAGDQAAIVTAPIRHRPKETDHRTKTLHFALHRTRGLVGVVKELNDAAFYGMDGGDAVYYVDKAGRVFRAESVEAAVEARWVGGEKIKDARDWDITTGVVAAIKETRVHVSTNGGRSFKVCGPPTRDRLVRLATRHDGVMVVQTEQSEAFISPDRGRTWRRSSFQPGGLSRQGAWIYAQNACDHAALSADGHTWIQKSPPDRYSWSRARRSSLGLQGWEVLLDASHKPLALPPGKHPNQSIPPAPAPSAGTKVSGKRQPCTEGGGGIGGIGLGGRSPGGCGYGTRGRGHLALCVRGTIGEPPNVSGLWVGWLGDGMTGDSPRAPTLVVVNHLSGELSIGSLPQGCDPAMVRSVRGTAVLVCKDKDKSQLYLADKKGAWRKEALLDTPPDRLDHVTAAEDGTLLMQSCQYSTERQKHEGSGYLCGLAFVRRPVKLGSSGAWRQVRVSDALTYRPLKGGRVLVVDREGAGKDTISLLVDGPRRTRPLARQIELYQDLQNLYVEKGRILARIGNSYDKQVLTRKKTFELLPRP